MPWPRKKSDPLSERERALSGEIAQLEAQIKKLDAKLQHGTPSQLPRVRSTATPGRGTVSRSPREAPRQASGSHEPIFEEVDQGRLTAQNETGASPGQYNDLGVRKYDLMALLRRIRNHFRGPTTTNPKLVSYLAAGGIQGLRPLRYEKRVARNRFIFLVIILFLTLLGLIWAFVHHTR